MDREKKSHLKFQNLMDMPSKPMEIEDVQLQIFEYLDIKSLKVVRLSFKLWQKAATREMLRKCFISVPRSFLHAPMGSEKENPYNGHEGLHQFFRNSQLPIRNVNIHSPFKSTPFEQIKILLHFGILGPNIRSLKYGPNPDQDLRMLFNYLPNLTKYCNYYVEQLYYDANHVKILMDAGKIHILKDYQFFPEFQNGLSNFETLERFSTCPGVQLERFSIGLIRVPEMWLPRVVSILNQILLSNRETIKDMLFWQPTGFLPSINFPIFPQLTQFQLMLNLNYITTTTAIQLSRQIFPTCFNFTQHFPNLTKVRLTLSNNFDGVPTNFQNYSHFTEAFPTTVGSAPLVKFLLIDSHYLHLHNLTILFPNIESLEIQCIDQLQDLQNFEWGSKFRTCLKTLTIRVVTTYRTAYPVIDEVLTGIKGELVEQMNLKPQLQPHFEIVPRQPCVFDLVDLVNLNLYISTVKLLAVENGMVISDVCGDFYFMSRPNCNIYLECCLDSPIEEQFFRMKAALVATCDLPNVNFKFRR